MNKRIDMKWLTAMACVAISFPMAAWQAPASQGPAPHSQLKRLYVEPFATKAGSERLRGDVIAELRKASSISLVSNESDADEILGGGGEIWVKGYRSLNPRSSTAPANGTPIYGGYLSVELRNTNGETIWSDLLTPSSGSEDVSKDLAKRIAKHVANAVEKAVPAAQPAAATQPSINLKGAGATFPYPVYQKWFVNYRRENPNVELTYDAIGSEAGVRKLLAGEVDFGASDSPEAISELAPGQEGRYLLFPSVVGAVVPIVNLPGLTGEIRFTPEALAGIYLGTIKKWNDPILARANRGLHLPDLEIVVVHRAEGSGTSYAWTDYLSKTSPAWKAQVGTALAPKWPCGRAATGNDGVAKLVKEFGGAIGYVQFIYALDNHVSFGKVRNQHGEFVEASLESIAAAVSGEVRNDFKMSLVDAGGPGAYPIASFTWLVVPAHVADDATRSSIAAFLKWMLGPGQAQAAALGYLELPKDLVGEEIGAIESIK